MRRIAFFAVLMLLMAAACFAEDVKPLAMTNSAVGGSALNSYTPGVIGGTGLNNIGLLIKTWGRVTAVDATSSCFYIDDGSGRVDGSGNVGLRVGYTNLAEGVTITPPALNSYVAITAISSTISIDSKIYSNLRPRSQSDIQVVF